jgi:peptidoglycan/xylan/chitin deacetylase (PgdA/CDA1 family)
VSVPRLPFDYSPLPQRPPLELPDGARVAVWIAVNVEHFAIDGPGVSIVPLTADLTPDPMNYGWRDYGARVGIWRLMEMFDELGLPITAPLHSDVCEAFPEIIEAGNERGWAWVAHGRTTAILQANMERDEERSYLEDTIGTIERLGGRRPRGWLGPALTETFNTPELLAELGLRYVCDWCNDDQPYPLRTTAGRVVSVPYSIEANDIPLLLAKGYTGEQYRQVLVDQFDALYAAGATTGQVMAIPLHPFLVGVPFRLRYLRDALEHILRQDDVWLTTGDEIADWYIDLLGRGQVPT